MGDYVDAAALGQVLLVSLIGGVGLIALYAFGIRCLAAGQEHGRRAATALATASFAVVVAGVLLGLYVLLDKG